VQPQNLSITLTAIAQTLQDRGSKLGRTLVQLNAYLHRWLPNLPALDNDIRELVQVTRTYSQAAPSIVQALNDFTVVNQTLVQQEANLSALFSTLTQSNQDLTSFLNQNKGNIIRLSSDGLATLKILARYSPEFPCVLEDLVKFEPNINRVLGAGTDQPGLHVHVNVQQPLGTATAPLGNYVPGKDTPFFGDNTGPHCYPIPFPGISLNDGATPVIPRATSASTSAAVTGPAAATSPASARGATTTGTSLPGGLSLANSPQENELINEISAPTLGVRPRSLPGWSSMLVGPLYRGRQVQLR